MAKAPTPRDLELLACAFKSCKEPGGFKVDYEKFASLAGLKNAATASSMWNATKKRFLSGAPDTTPAADKNADADMNEDEATPSKKPRPRKPKAVKKKEVKGESPDNKVSLAVKKEEGSDEDGDLALPKTPATKKRVRKANVDGEPNKTPAKRAKKAPAAKSQNSSPAQEGTSGAKSEDAHEVAVSDEDAAARAEQMAVDEFAEKE